MVVTIVGRPACNQVMFATNKDNMLNLSLFQVVFQGPGSTVKQLRLVYIPDYMLQLSVWSSSACSCTVTLLTAYGTAACMLHVLILMD